MIETVVTILRLCQFRPHNFPQQANPDIYPKPADFSLAHGLQLFHFLVASGYYLVRRSSASFPCVCRAIGGLFALMQKETCHAVFSIFPDGFSPTSPSTCFMLSLHFSERHSAPLCIASPMLGPFLHVVLGYFGIKMSETQPKILEAEAVSWLLKTSTNKDPAWFQKAVQIAKESFNLLMPTLCSWRSSSHYFHLHGLGGITHDYHRHSCGSVVHQGRSRSGATRHHQNDLINRRGLLTDWSNCRPREREKCPSSES